MPSYNFLFKYAEENQMGFCWLLLPPLLSPHTSPQRAHEHTFQHTRAHLHPLFKLGIEILSTLVEITSG